ncbi:ArsR/SmtB family transcription factor [Methanocella sp. MCL-LM]|uniref:ArsR/SmtB family transcription factor n=1 Tax=Methanocella sp. MCL-LM TaxID=3412035 RepID=UPI003C714C81
MEELPVNPYPLSKVEKEALEKIKVKNCKVAAEVCKAIADPVRIKILEALRQRELCVCVLVDLTGLQYSTLSYHLKQLKDTGLISSDKDGSYLIYSLTPKGKVINSLLPVLDDRF